MKNEKIDFYSPIDLKTYNLESTIRYQLRSEEHTSELQSPS